MMHERDMVVVHAWVMESVAAAAVSDQNDRMFMMRRPFSSSQGGTIFRIYQFCFASYLFFFLRLIRYVQTVILGYTRPLFPLLLVLCCVYLYFRFEDKELEEEEEEEEKRRRRRSSFGEGKQIRRIGETT